MEEARQKFKETVNKTKLFFTKDREGAKKLSHKQFESILGKLKKLLVACNDNNKEEDDDDDKWTEDVEAAIVEHGGWTRYESDIKKLKEKWEMEKFKENFILSGVNDDDENSNNKNKKRNRSKSIEVLQPSKKKRKQNKNSRDGNQEIGINEDEVCLTVLLILFHCQRVLFAHLRHSIECKDPNFGGCA